MLFINVGDFAAKRGKNKMVCNKILMNCKYHMPFFIDLWYHLVRKKNTKNKILSYIFGNKHYLVPNLISNK